MWRTKKGILLLTMSVIVILAGSIVGVIALAQDGTEGQNELETKYDTLMSKAAQIYQEKTGTAIDTQQLKDAFAEAQAEMRSEALQNWLNGLVENGKLTQEEADAYLTWWEAKPDVQLPEGPCGFGRMMKGDGNHGRGFGFVVPESDTSDTPDISGSGY